MSPPVEDNAADTLPRASHSPSVRVGGRTADPVWSEFIRTQHKKGYWAVCKHCGSGMKGKVAVALARIRGCSLVPEELKAAYCSVKAEPAGATPGEPPKKAPCHPATQLKFSITSRPQVSSTEQLALDKQLTRAIASALLPFVVAEDLEFRKF